MEHQLTGLTALTGARASGAKALALAGLWVMVAACDTAAEAEPNASVEAQGAANVVVESEATLEAETKTAGSIVVEPASFDLEAVAGVVKTGEIESAAELEVIVNDEARGYNRIDIDADGKIDHVQVVEVKGPAIAVDAAAEVEVEADAVLELRAIPSSTASVEAAITFATVSFARHPVDSEVEIRATYTAVVRQPEVRVYTHVVPVRIEAGVVVGGSLFLSWLYTVERPVYVGVYEVDARGHWIPPGHLKHGHWKADGYTDGRGEVRVKEKGHGKADGRVMMDVRGSGKASGKIQLGGSAGFGKSSKHDDRGGGSKGGGGSKATKSSSSGGSKGGKGSSGGGSKGKGGKGK